MLEPRRFSQNKELLAEEIADDDIFVGTQISSNRDIKVKSGELAKRVAAVTNNKTFAYIDANLGSVLYNLPQASLSSGKEYYIKKVDNTLNLVTIKPYSGDLIDGETEIVIEFQNTAICLVCNGVGWNLF
jgi:hypothetical protein